MMSIHLLKQFIPLYPGHIIIMNMLSGMDIHYGYSDIIAQFPIVGNI
ncbi:MAG: hypothetical protein ACTS73_02895 [Arsenophonus sp. NEOnobi-MAG3]